MKSNLGGEEWAGIIFVAVFILIMGWFVVYSITTIGPINDCIRQERPAFIADRYEYEAAGILARQICEQTDNQGRVRR